jgi:hypothetical protein
MPTIRDPHPEPIRSSWPVVLLMSLAVIVLYLLLASGFGP